MLHKDNLTSGFRVLTPSEVEVVSGGNGNCTIVTNIEIRFNYDTNQNEEVTTYHLLCQTEDSPRYVNVTQTASYEGWQSADNFDPNNQDLIEWIIDMLDLNDGQGGLGTTSDGALAGTHT